MFGLKGVVVPNAFGTIAAWGLMGPSKMNLIRKWLLRETLTIPERIGLGIAQPAAKAGLMLGGRQVFE